MDDWEGIQVPELSRLARDRQGDGCSNGPTDAVNFAGQEGQGLFVMKRGGAHFRR
jgi:hypothetical protein